MKHALTTIAGAIAATALAPAAQAGVVFSDNFDTYANKLNAVTGDLGTSWTVTGPGNVDVIGVGSGFDLQPGNGRYVDLGGSNGSFGLLATAPTFAAGSYVLSFSLAGTQRGPGNTTTIKLGDWSTLIAKGSADPFTTYSIGFTTTGGTLSFQDSGGNGNVGNLLDNVVLSAVPEPATWALMIAGFAIVGAALRRRAPVPVSRIA